MAFKIILFCAVLAFAQAGVLTPVTYIHKTASYPQVDAVASTHESVVRSFDGTVSHHSKSVDTPFSSVRKTDTRVNNNVYTPAVAKTVTYAAPLTNTVYSHAAPAVLHKTLYTPTASAPLDYSAPSHVQYEKFAPADLYTHAAPAVTKTLSYAAPASHVQYEKYAPADLYTHAAPAVTKTLSYAAPASHVQYEKYAPADLYTHAAPAVTKTLTYAAPAPNAQVYHHGAPTTTYQHGPVAATYSHNDPAVSAYGSSQTVHYSPANMVSHMSFDGFGTHWGF